jgi:hypothetical protein
MAVSRDCSKIAIISDKEVAMYTSSNDEKVLLRRNVPQRGAVTFGVKYLFLYTERLLELYRLIDGKYVEAYCIWNIQQKPVNGHILSCHPYKNEVAYVRGEGCVVISNLENNNDCHLQRGNLIAVEYSFDGEYFALNDRRTGWGFISHPTQNKSNFIERFGCNDNFFHLSIAFHKNNILAAMLTRNGTVQFIDYKKNTELKEINFEEKIICKDSYIPKLLAFTPDGKKLVIAINNKYFVYPLPLDLIYMGTYKERFIQARWFLKNVCKGEMQLSQVL